MDCPLTNWTAHCDRLRWSLQTFGWQLPDWKQLRQGAESLLPDYPVLRIAIFTDGRELIIGRSLPGNLQELQQQGVIAWVAQDSLFRRELSAHKTGNYLAAWLARQQAQRLGATEAILVDPLGNWLESSTGNLWGWKDGRWQTPPLEAGILPGIVRAKLLDWLQVRQLPVEQNIWNCDFVKTLEAIAYTNSVFEVVPLRAIVTPQVNLTTNPFHPALEQLRSYWLEK